MMTRKDLQDLAETLGPALCNIPLVYSAQILNPLCSFLEKQNPQFNRGRFVAEVTKAHQGEAVITGTLTDENPE